MTIHRKTAVRAAWLIVLLVPASLVESIWLGSVGISATRYCGCAVLLYDSGRFCNGPAGEMLTLDHLESLYQCRLDAIGTAGTQVFVPH